jgi:rubrerythrin
MDMLHFALEQEMQIEQYYRQLALISECTAVKEVFLNMADAEHTHVMALQEYERSQNVCATSFEYVECCDWIKVLETDPPEELAEAAMEMYEAARDVKWQEEQFYVHAAEKTEIPLERLLFNGLRKDENKGAVLIDRLCYSMLRDNAGEFASASA